MLSEDTFKRRQALFKCVQGKSLVQRLQYMPPLREAFKNPVLLIDASNAFNLLNRQVTLQIVSLLPRGNNTRGSVGHADVCDRHYPQGEDLGFQQGGALGSSLVIAQSAH